MKGLKVNVKEIGMTVAGNAVGLVAVHQVSKIGFIQKISKPAVRGLVNVALGALVLPMVADKMGMAGKKNGSAFVDGASNAITTYGVGQILSSIPATKNLVPAVAGYEDPIYIAAAVVEDPEPESGEPVSGTANDVYM